MRKFLPILALLFLATTCHAGHTVLQQNNCIGPRPGTIYQAPCPFGVANLAGDGIVAITIGSGIQYPSCGVSDSNGNTYVSAGQLLGPASTSQVTMQVAFNIFAGANTVTSTCNSFDYASIYIFEVQGALGQPNLIDQVSGGTCTACHTQSTGSITTTVSNEIIFVAAFEFQNFSEVFATGWSDSAGWLNPLTHNDSQDGTTGLSSHTVNMIVSSTGSYADNVSFTGGPASPNLVTMIASFSFGSATSTLVHRRQIY